MVGIFCKCTSLLPEREGVGGGGGGGGGVRGVQTVEQTVGGCTHKHASTIGDIQERSWYRFGGQPSSDNL